MKLAVISPLSRRRLRLDASRQTCRRKHWPNRTAADHHVEVGNANVVTYLMQDIGVVGQTRAQVIWLDGLRIPRRADPESANLSPKAASRLNASVKRERVR